MNRIEENSQINLFGVVFTVGNDRVDKVSGEKLAWSQIKKDDQRSLILSSQRKSLEQAVPITKRFAQLTTIPQSVSQIEAEEKNKK
jgi:hypothetical protein